MKGRGGNWSLIFPCNENGSQDPALREDRPVRTGQDGAPLRRPTVHLRGISMIPRRSLGFQRAVFPARNARRSSRAVLLSGDLLCAAQDERESCFEAPLRVASIASTVTTFGASLAHLGL